METVRRDAARVAIVDPAGRVLLLHAVLPDEDWWELPGGGVEPDEEPEQAATRELREETGIVVDELQELGTVGTEFAYDERWYLQQETVFLASASSTAVRLPDPGPTGYPRHLEYRWWEASELLETEAQIHPPQLPQLLRSVRGVERRRNSTRSTR